MSISPTTVLSQSQLNCRSHRGNVFFLSVPFPPLPPPAAQHPGELGPEGGVEVAVDDRVGQRGRHPYKVAQGEHAHVGQLGQHGVTGPGQWTRQLRGKSTNKPDRLDSPVEDRLNPPNVKYNIEYVERQPGYNKYNHNNGIKFQFKHRCRS